MQFFYKKTVVRALTVLTGIYALYYIFWRAAETLNYSAPVFSIILLAAEAGGVITFLLFSVTTWNYGGAEQYEAVRGVPADVFVLSNGEDLTVIEAALTGCLNIRGENTVYVIDCAARHEVKDLAWRLGCEYLPQVNGASKISGIYEALKVSGNEFITILDADTVPQPDILEKTLCYFDKNTAAVQLPRGYYNLDSMQHSELNQKSYRHEQQLFHNVIQPGRDGIGSALWCISPSVARRSALADLGGTVQHSVSDGYLASIRLNALGWKIRFQPQALAFCTVPQDYNAFLKQKLDGAREAMNILKSRDNPLIKKGLKAGQRISHFAGLVSYFGAYRKLIYLLTPIIVLITGVLPVNITGRLDFLFHWLPYIALMLICYTAAGRGYYELFEAEKFNMLKITAFIRASLDLVKRKKYAEVNTKAARNYNSKGIRGIAPQFIILAASAASSVYAIACLALSPAAASEPFGIYAALIWSAFNISALVPALSGVLKRKNPSRDFRFPVDVKALITDRYGNRYETRIEDISRGGMSIILKEPKKQVYWNDDIAASENVTYPKYADKHGEVFRYEEVGALNRVAIKSVVFRERALLDGSDISVCLPGGIISVIGKVAYDRDLGGGRRKIGFKFVTLNSDSKAKLINFLYVTAPRKLYQQGLISPRGIVERKRRFVLKPKSV